MKMTRNFKLSEFAVSNDYPKLAKTVSFSDIDKTKIFYLCSIYLQPVRDLFGPVKILSGKRSLALNRNVGGSITSDHLYSTDTHGAAVDFVAMNASMLDVFEHIKNTRHKAYGQLILYTKSNFIHLSLPSTKHTGEAWVWNK